MFDAREKMVELQASVTPFYFMDLEGLTHELPNTQLLTGEQVAQLMGPESEKLLKEINPAAFEAIQKMPQGVGEALAMAWVEHGGESGKEPAESPETPTAG